MLNTKSDLSYSDNKPRQMTVQGQSMDCKVVEDIAVGNVEQLDFHMIVDIVAEKGI
jgi:hypothetical protein